MNREWKPGDVAVIRVPASTAPGYTINERGYTDVRATFNAARGWSALENPDYFWGEGYSFHDAEPRPLAAIDPEDTALVRLLASLYMSAEQDGKVAPLRAMQAALREFANPTPPKPDEPTGQYAVVEDDQAREWCRIDVSNGYAWQLLGQPSGQCRYEGWRNVRAVRVLSDGVQP